MNRVASQDVPLVCFLADAVARGEQRGALVPHGLARGCTALAQGCNVVLSLRTLRTRRRTCRSVKGAAKIRNNSVRKLSAGTKRGRPPGKVSYVPVPHTSVLGGQQLRVRSFWNTAVAEDIPLL